MLRASRNSFPFFFFFFLDSIHSHSFYCVLNLFCILKYGHNCWALCSYITKELSHSNLDYFKPNDSAFNWISYNKYFHHKCHKGSFTMEDLWFWLAVLEPWSKVKQHLHRYIHTHTYIFCVCVCAHTTVSQRGSHHAQHRREPWMVHVLLMLH